MNTFATNTSKELKDQCETFIPTICEARVAKSIESLLAEDLASVKEMCVKIATRLATERINQWIQSHIMGGSLFIRDMELELNRFSYNNTPLHPIQGKEHNPNAVSPTTITNDLRVSICLFDAFFKYIKIKTYLTAILLGTYVEYSRQRWSIFNDNIGVDHIG